ncbi:MAG TPA: ABATE domain-containing protein [Burkholderiales bacterium]
MSPSSAPPSSTLIQAPRGDLCLDFVNTLYWRGSPTTTESLNTPGQLLAWIAAQVGYPGEALRPIEAWAREAPREAQHLFELALAMREALYRIFRAVAGGAAVAAPDLAALNFALAEAPRRGELVQSEAGFLWRSTVLKVSVPSLLAPVLWSAADLLTHAAPQRIRQCANPKCLWLFVDASKGGTRRWCDMNACGNRAKAQRHYHKSKQG